MKVIGIIVLFLSTCNAIVNVGNNMVQYTIALKQNNIDILEKALLDISNYKSPNYGKYWSKEDILNHIKPFEEEVNKVTEWLDKYNTEYYNYGDALLCKNNIHDIEKMYNIRLVRMSNNYLVLGNYNIPNNLRNIIVFIEGLSNNDYSKGRIKPVKSKNKLTTGLTLEKSYSQPSHGYASREVINKLYNITWNKIKTNGSIASIEYQGNSGYSESDLLLSQKENAESIKGVTKNHVIGNDEGSDLESQLDMQMMSQVAENVNLWFWDEPQWLYSFAVDFFNHSNIPDVISMSWGWAERDQCSITDCNNKTAKQYINRVNAEYIKIGLRGVTITVASGDAGAPGRTSESCDKQNPVNPVFPGSSPWVTSVGGTFVLNSSNQNNWKTPLCKTYGCINGTIEMNTNQKYVGWTTGGGFGIYSSENRPKWQDEAVAGYLDSYIPLPSNFNVKGRAYPDVSAIGHNCAVFDSGEISDVDGTSCSSPVFAAIVSLLNDYQVSNGKSKLGFINPILYEMAKDNVFNDWTVGNNWCTEYNCCPVRGQNAGSDFGYMATKGWDPVYGLGTPNVGKMIDWLSVNA
jgi:subtilase family serine protease